MRNAKKRSVLICSLVTAAISLVSALAWACTPQSTITVAVNVGRPGKSVPVTGDLLQPGPAEIRWNSLDGPAVSPAFEPSGTTYSTQITVPQTEPGVYYMILVSSGQVVARQPFEVNITAGAGTASEVVASDLWSGLSATADSATSPAGVEHSGGSPSGRSGMGLGISLLAVGIVCSGLSLAAVAKRSKAKG